MVDSLAHVLTGSLVPVLALLAFSTPLVDKLTRNKKLIGFMSVIAGAWASIASSIMYYWIVVNEKPIIYGFGGWPPHFGISYAVDGLNGIIGLMTSWVFLAIALYSLWYGRHLDEPVWYHVLLIGLLAGMLGCLYTGDAFNLFVMLEVLGISAYGLVAFHKERAEAVEASAKYALIGAVATTIYFTALVVVYATFGSLNMGVLSCLSRTPSCLSIVPVVGSIEVYRLASLLAVALSLWVFTYKAALFPNHFWLPDAHPEAPTPVSAALSGLVVNIGVYATMRFLYTIFGEGSLLGEYRSIVLIALFILGVAGALLGALMMMIQKDIKRLLAYSTVSHMGLIFMVLSAPAFSSSLRVTELAVAAAALHIISHGVSKALLFMTSGIFIDSAGTRNMDEMRGIGRKHPLASTAFTIGFLNLIGLVPFIGFFSKLLMYQAYMEAGFPIGGVLLIIASAVSIPGYLKALYSIVFAIGSEKSLENTGHSVEVLMLAISISLLVMGGLVIPLLGLVSNTELTSTSLTGALKYVYETFSAIMKLGGAAP
ncbi:cation:proton antiporter [Thermosphaera chiliense]|uniref:Cation:proton antiporter n=1 Tax=Thermosphaera chiliense TaxID=3402707 RepID=A0A7M1USB8_9CREN|nr:proton-conducting transporter membrane subunit [Thermosphaera aggregans]QOR93912.1 cation:proton antiporter [Thermosphaera aggregans]